MKQNKTIMAKLTFSIITILLLSPLCTASSSVSLTVENYEEKTKGKTVFIKFFAPWCGHCQELAPKWEQMAQEWVDHKQGLVGEIDCTKQKTLCATIGSLPTLKYGDPYGEGSFLIEYNGDKDYGSLSQFSKDTLVSSYCGPGSLEACEDVMKGRLQYFMSMGQWELEGAIRDHEDRIESVTAKYDHDYKVLQADYDAKASEQQAFLSRIQTSIKMIQSVRDYRKGDDEKAKDSGEL